jgi:alpha-1,2-mannosyltransferase
MQTPSYKSKYVGFNQTQFGIELNANNMKFLKLKRWAWLEASSWKRFTLIGQSFGSMIVGWEAICLYRPLVLVESVGFAFIYPLAKLFGAKIIAYVHYPTIRFDRAYCSSDMLKAVSERRTQFNNDHRVSRSSWLSAVKLAYYKAISVMYGWAGSFADIVMVEFTYSGQLHLDK